MSRGFTAANVPDQTGKTIMVTGANTGLGLEMSKVLAANGARVLLACRNENKAEAAMETILSETPSADLTFIPLDQGDLASIKNAVKLVKKEKRLDVLINNAGIMMPPKEYTKDGFESQIGVNHFGTFALTCQLLDKLAQQKDSRVVITSSLAHRSGRINFKDIDAKNSYNAYSRYQQSKLANLLFMFELDRRLRASGSPIMAVASHPGIATTELFRRMPSIVMLAKPLMSLVLNSASDGAWSSLMAATSPDVVSGGYYGPKSMSEMSGPAGKANATMQSRDEDLAKKLWELSVERTGVDPKI